jgi:hypothetical protein
MVKQILYVAINKIKVMHSNVYYEILRNIAISNAGVSMGA